MSTDGAILKAYVDESRIRPIRIYEAMGISKQAFYKLYNSKEFEPDTIKKLEKAIGKQWEEIKKVKVDVNVPRETDYKKSLPEGIDFSQPVMQIVLNLSYQGRKDSDSMNIMAATNRRNTEIIAALVGAMLPNSKLVDQSDPSPSGSNDDDDLPSIEEMLGKEGIDLLRRQWQAGKMEEKSK